MIARRTKIFFDGGCRPNPGPMDIAVVTGGVAATPVRHRTIEMRLRQRPLDEAAVELAGQLSIQKVRPLRHNDYKIALMRSLVRRAVRGTQEA